MSFIHRRLGLIVAGAVVALAAIEGGFRLTSSRLPSLAALPPDLELGAGDCAATAPLLELSGESRGAIAVLGDSMVAGRRVPVERRLEQQLSDALLADHGWDLRTVTSGAPGDDLCGLLARSRGVLPKGISAGVFTVFTDDLENHHVVGTPDGLAAAPSSSSPFVAWWIEHSWAANAVWFAWRVRARPATARPVGPEHLATLRDGVDEVDARFVEAGTPRLWVLVEPVGMHRCGSDPKSWDRCQQHASDGDLLADLLSQAGGPFLDARGIWTDSDTQGIDYEHGALLRMHPGDRGVTELVRVLAPALDAQLRASAQGGG